MDWLERNRSPPDLSGELRDSASSVRLSQVALQRKHECNEIVPLIGGQGIEVISSRRCLAGVQLNRIKNGDVQPLMHEPVACTNAPEWRRAHLVCRGLSGVLDNSIPRADIV